MRKPKSENMRAFDAELGKRLARVRTSLDVKAKDLARSAGITGSAVYNYEAGLSSCPPSVLAAFAAYLGVSVTALIPNHITYCLPEDSREKSLNRV